jgi:hypothetical protein
MSRLGRFTFAKRKLLDLSASIHISVYVCACDSAKIRTSKLVDLYATERMKTLFKVWRHSLQWLSLVTICYSLA